MQESWYPIGKDRWYIHIYEFINYNVLVKMVKHLSKVNENYIHGKKQNSGPLYH